MKNTLKIIASVLALAFGAASYIGVAEAAMMKKGDHMMMHKCKMMKHGKCMDKMMMKHHM